MQFNPNNQGARRESQLPHRVIVYVAGPITDQLDVTVANLKLRGYTVYSELNIMKAHVYRPISRHVYLLSRMQLLLCSDLVVITDEVSTTEAMMLRSVCLYSGQRLVRHEHLPALADAGPDTLDRLNMLSPNWVDPDAKHAPQFTLVRRLMQGLMPKRRRLHATHV